MITTSCTSASARAGCGTAITGLGPSPSRRPLWDIDSEPTERHNIQQAHPAVTPWSSPDANSSARAACAAARECVSPDERLPWDEGTQRRPHGLLLVPAHALCRRAPKLPTQGSVGQCP